MDPLQLVKLDRLMIRSSGRPEVVIGLIDGPVAMDHPDLTRSSIRELPGAQGASCSVASSVACMHGTFVAGVLSAKRGSAAPAICPECTLLVRPIFPERNVAIGQMPSATAQDLSSAIQDVVKEGARIINLSAALLESTSLGLGDLKQSLDFAALRSAIIIAAAGNQSTVSSTVITRHPWVTPIASCDQSRKPTGESNLGISIGRRGLAAPGQYVTSLGTDGKTSTLSGTSAAAPFVTGTIALLWSEFPGATATKIRLAVTQSASGSRRAIAPPLLDAWAASEFMSRN